MAKTLKKQDIAEFANDELVEKIKEEKTKYIKAKFNHAVSPLDNPLSLREMRRNIARLKTELRKREIEAQKNKKQ
ncbi:MAG: 50S ribosomal protein L29 [Chitinophagales bacterium]|nr:MAG: 50S ribosomal protein L29 [Chitinophagales bacterium]